MQSSKCYNRTNSNKDNEPGFESGQQGREADTQLTRSSHHFADN